MVNTSSFRFFVRVCCISCFVPWISFGKSELINKKFAVLTKIFVLVIYALNILWFAVIDMSVYFILVLFLFCVYARNICLISTQWNNLFQLFSNTDTILQNRLNKSLELGQGSTVIFMTYIILMVPSRILAVHFNKSRNLAQECLFMMMCFAIWFSITCLNMVTAGLKIITKCTKHLHTRRKWKLSSQSGIDAVLCEKLYTNLYDISVCLNEIFGWLWSFLFAQTITLTCLVENFLIQNMLNLKLEISDLTNFGSAFLLFLVSTYVTHLYIFYFSVI